MTPRSNVVHIGGMTDGQMVSLKDGTKAQLKQVQISSWQTVLIAVELPAVKTEQRR